MPILIDQEGGRVARMRPPEWPAFPSGEAFDRLYQLAPSSAIEAARVNARALGLMLHEVGVNVDCLPMLDVRQPGATDIVGDRALGSEPMQVAALGRAILDGLASAGVLGVIKHIPGHGRALVDSHQELPVVDAGEDELAIDLEPFERLRDAPMGMTAHVALHRLGRRAPGEPVADRHPRHHPRADRLRRLPDERRHRHGGAGRRPWPARGGRASRRAATSRSIATARWRICCWSPTRSGELTAEGEARLARAMAMRFTPDDEMDFAEAVAKRDALLALV